MTLILSEIIKESCFFQGSFGKNIQSNDLDKIPIERLNLTVRFNHVILIKKIQTVLELLNTDFNNLLCLKNCGKKSIIDTRNKILDFVKEMDPDIQAIIDSSKNSLKFRENISAESKYKLNQMSSIQLNELSINQKINKPLKNISLLKTAADLAKYNSKESDLDITDNRLSNEDFDKILFQFSRIYIPPFDIMDILLETLDNRTLEILTQRFDDRKYKTYQEIGNKYKLTRERIRQIINNLINRLSDRIKNKEYYVVFLNILIANPKPITYLQLENKPSIKRKYSENIYIGILSAVFEEVPFKKFLNKDIEQSINRKIDKDSRLNKLLRFLKDYPFTHHEITPQIFTNQMINMGFKLEEQLLCFKIILSSTKLVFFEENHQYFLLKKGGLRDITYTILCSSKKPLNVSDIMDTIHKYYCDDSKYDSLNSFIGNIKQDDRIIQFDRYTFGLEKHFSYQKNHWTEICLLAKKFLLNKNRQCYVKEIFENIISHYPKLRSKYELVPIIRSDKEIIDLGFFTFCLQKSGMKNRIKLKDIILNIYNNNSKVRHYLELWNEIQNIRHVRIESLNMLLKHISELTKYPCSFYGLKHYNEDNIAELAKNQLFIRKYLSSNIYPDTRILKLLEFFELEDNKKNCSHTIQSIENIKLIDWLTDTQPFFVIIDWSITRLIKCVLFNYHKPMHLTEVRWILDDLHIPEEKFENSKVRLFEDKQIIKNNNTIEFFNYNLKESNSDLIDKFYDFLLETNITITIKDFMTEFIDDLNFEGLNEEKLRAILEEDERFLISNEIIMVKTE